MAQGYLVFHLNLAFSSINTEVRTDVLKRCYWPLLELAEQSNIPLGIELTGWTLQQISQLDPSWLEHFRQMLLLKQCELIGSGWTQLIGPLVPYQVNQWNQRLGLAAYQQFLGITPTLALVNEMAFSSGIVNIYAEAGYQGIIMDRDNVRLALGLDHTALSTTPTHAQGQEDCVLPVLWSDSILFQRLQRVVHGDIPMQDYLAYVQQRLHQDDQILPIYCNDAEIFDYRPGRFSEESRLHPEGEWQRVQRVCKALQQDCALTWMLPSEALASNLASQIKHVAQLTSASQPIPVKKQAKYNINRWAVTGRDDLWLNTMCHKLYQSLILKQSDHEEWRELCELWASDFRTHITTERWQDMLLRITMMLQHGQNNFPCHEVNVDVIVKPTHSIHQVDILKDAEGIFWTIKTAAIHLVLNVRRGLAIKSLAFVSHQFNPILGTLAQGYFHSIELGVDFYSGGIVIETPSERSRTTDLEWVQPEIVQDNHVLTITASLSMQQNSLKKVVVIDLMREYIELQYHFDEWVRPLGTVRVGHFTLLPEAIVYPLQVGCINGGKTREWFVLDHSVNHGRAASTLVSSTAAFGATDGSFVITDAQGQGVNFSWDPARCAAIPMVQHQGSQHRYLTRLLFSLAEIDDTTRAEGRLMPFSVMLTPG